MTIYEYTKRLGQAHHAESGKSTTLCGIPMLGNNYAKYIREEDKTACKECEKLMLAI